MNPASPILAELVVDLPKRNRSFGHLSELLFSDVMLIIGIGVGLLLLLAGSIYGWRAWRRKRRRHVSGGQKVYRGSHNHDEESRSAEPEEAPAAAGHHGDHDDHDHDHDHDDGDHANRRRYKYRVRRRTHRTRNPTLSETGGLPPSKTQAPTERA